jgi:hypothetical protein
LAINSEKILEELMKTNKQLVKLEKEEFNQKSLAELKIKDKELIGFLI